MAVPARARISHPARWSGGCLRNPKTPSSSKSSLKENAMAKFLFVLGAGMGNANSPTRCYQFAQVAHQEGHEVNIFLIDEGVVFGRKGATANVVAPSGEEMALATEYIIQNKIPVYVCLPCAKARHITEDILVEGAQLSTGKKLIELAAESKVFTFS
jgi:sulfur relay (sulfurtransferase) complex TusBCD TusD component (DsrE family)